MDLIKIIAAIFQGNIEPGENFTVNGIKVEVQSKTKFTLELPGEAKTECDISECLSTQRQSRVTD